MTELAILIATWWIVDTLREAAIRIETAIRDIPFAIDESGE